MSNSDGNNPKMKLDIVSIYDGLWSDDLTEDKRSADIMALTGKQFHDCLKFAIQGYTDPANEGSKIKSAEQISRFRTLLDTYVNDPNSKWFKLSPEEKAKILNGPYGEHGDTALTYAARHGDKDLVKLLIDAGATVDLGDKNRLTPLMKAAYRGHSDVVKLLIDSEANTTLKDENGNTALDLATKAKEDALKAAGNNEEKRAEVNSKFDPIIKKLTPPETPEPVATVATNDGVALSAALPRHDLDEIRTIIRDFAGDVNEIKTILAKQGMTQHYFLAAQAYYSAEPEGKKEPRNKDLAKKFERLQELQVYIDGGAQAKNVKSEDEARNEIISTLNNITADVSNGLTDQDKKAIGFIVENSKPKDKAQELRNAIAEGLAGNILEVIESTDDEIIKNVLSEKEFGAKYCNAFVIRHGATPQVSKQYKALSALYQKLDTEKDESKRKEIQTKIAGALQSLSSAEGLDPGEKKVITLLQSVYQHPESHVINGGMPDGVNIPQGQPGGTPPVLNPVQEGVALAQAKAEEEKTPWYKQEWIWWVLGIALAATLGYFSFRKGGWLNKDDDDKKSVVVNSNTNDNSNSNSNSNTGNESGGTLDNSAQNITSAELNDMIASGGRVSRPSSDRS